MKEWSEFFYWELLNNQLKFAKSMHSKYWERFYDVLRAWRMKDTLPLYNDLALHKIVEKEFKHTIPKSTISTWISTIPELLANKEKLDELLEKNIVKEKKVDERKLTKAEWDYLHRLEGEQLNQEYRIFLEKMNNPKATDKELMELTGASRRLMYKINNYWLTMTEPYSQKKFIGINEDIMMSWKQIILDKLDSIEVSNFRDLKALSSILDDSMKQNQLLTWGPTERVAHGIDEVYEAMQRKQEQLWDWTIQDGEVERITQESEDYRRNDFREDHEHEEFSDDDY